MEANQTKVLKFLVMAPPRSGSTWLCNLLEQNGIMQETESQYESMHFYHAWTDDDLRTKTLKQLIDTAFQNSELQFNDTRIQSFKFLSSHFRNIADRYRSLGLNPFSMHEILSIMLEGDTQVIILDRRDIDAVTASWVNAMITNQWHNKEGVGSPKLADSMILFHKFNTMFHKFLLKDHGQFKAIVPTNYLQIYYENILVDPQATIRQCFNFLGLMCPEQIKLKSDYKIQRVGQSLDLLRRHKRFKPKFLLDLIVYFAEVFNIVDLKKNRFKN